MTRRAVTPWLVVAGVLVAALSLRGPIIAVTPVLPAIIADLGIGSAAAGLLTTAPVLMFAAVTPVAALVIRRAGPELALLLTLVGVLAGSLIRALPGYSAMLVGMFVMGAAITIGNVVIPVIIRRDLPPERAAVATALYAATLNVGSLLTALGTAPLAELLGWSAALLAWAGITVIGLALWVVHIVRSGAWRGEERSSGEVGRVERRGARDEASMTGPLPVIVDSSVRATMRRPVVWLLLVAFGLQSAMYYGMSTWLPSMLIDMTGASAATAGALSSVFQGVAIPGALIAPLLLRFLGPVPSAVTMAVCWAAMAIGMLTAPELAWLWAALGAVGHSAGFVLIFTVLVRTARSDAEAATMSATVQGAGYLLSAVGAPLLGAVREASGGWQAPLIGVLFAIVLYAGVLIAAMAGGMRRGPA